MDNLDRFEMIVKVKCPIFQSGKKKHRYIKSIITEINKRFNKHTVDLGDWPLITQVVEDKSVSNFLSLHFVKSLEPEENALQTMNEIVAYMKSDLHLEIDVVKQR